MSAELVYVRYYIDFISHQVQQETETQNHI